MKTFRIPLRVVFYKEEGTWIAHCLEFDLCGDGSSQKEALGQLSEAIALQLTESFQNRNLRNLFSPAPSAVQEKFFAGKETVQGELHLSVERIDSFVIENSQYREYSEDVVDASDCGLVPA